MRTDDSAMCCVNRRLIWREQAPRGSVFAAEHLGTQHWTAYLTEADFDMCMKVFVFSLSTQGLYNITPVMIDMKRHANQTKPP